MNKKYIILDTETTGLEVQQGHRVIEIGAVLLNDRKKSEENFHSYLNPERLIDDEASKVHGITNADLDDKPFFSDIAEEFLEFIEGSTLVIHNAPFDVGFLNNEINLVSSKLSLKLNAASFNEFLNSPYFGINFISLFIFIVLFIIAIIINSYHILPEPATNFIVLMAKRLLIITLFLVGSTISIKDLKSTGMKPIVFALTLWIFISIFSLIYILN